MRSLLYSLNKHFVIQESEVHTVGNTYTTGSMVSPVDLDSDGDGTSEANDSGNYAGGGGPTKSPYIFKQKGFSNRYQIKKVVKRDKDSPKIYTRYESIVEAVDILVNEFFR